MATPGPVIGKWYRLHGEQRFEVVAVDEDAGTIEVQYFDGTVEEFDLDDWVVQWKGAVLEAADAPDDWSGSFDMDGRDEAGDMLDGSNPEYRLNVGD